MAVVGHLAFAAQADRLQHPLGAPVGRVGHTADRVEIQVLEAVPQHPGRRLSRHATAAHGRVQAIADLDRAPVRHGEEAAPADHGPARLLLDHPKATDLRPGVMLHAPEKPALVPEPVRHPALDADKGQTGDVGVDLPGRLQVGRPTCAHQQAIAFELGQSLQHRPHLVTEGRAC